MRENAPIVYVSHDEDDHGWQLHGAQPAQMKYAMLVALKEVIAIDFTVCEIGDIPPGWIAHRKSAGDEWIREKEAVMGEAGFLILKNSLVCFS